MSQSILKMEQIVKSFGAVNVLKGVDFDLAKGEVHALVGGNGAGKSTLMKIMTGVYTKDSGKIIIKGEEKEIKSTNDAKENGIAMIFQEMSLVPSLTIAENIFLGYELKKHGMRDVKLMKQETEKVLKRLGLDLDPGTPVSELSVGLCQMVEIAKAVSKNAWGRNNYITFEIHGTLGSLYFNYERRDELQVCFASDPDDRRGFRTIYTGPNHPYGNGLWPIPALGIGYTETKIVECYDFFNAIANDTQASPNFEDGYEIELISDAILKSAQTHTWVDVH